MEFTFDQAYKYFTYRLPLENIPAKDSVIVHCPFHADRTPSLSLSIRKGVWKCHTCNEAGGILAFEQKMMNTSADEAWQQIAEISGVILENGKNKGYAPKGELVAIYDYLDPDGKLLYQKQRYERNTDEGVVKDFIQRAPLENGRWKYSLNGIEKVLYNLPDILTSNVLFISEGEKTANILKGFKLDGFRIASTTTFDGAGKWKQEYAPYFAGKHAVIFSDNDEKGRRHALDIAESVFKFAHTVKIVYFDELLEKEDVYDYLQTHSPEDLLSKIKLSPRWKPEEQVEKVASPFIVTLDELMPEGSGVDWLVKGVIHRDSKGMIVASPKAGKSLLALDLGVALASNQSWLGFPVLGRTVRTAIVSREDGANLTRERTYSFMRGRGIDSSIVNHDLYFNTHKQRPTFSLEKDEDVEDAARGLKESGIEFCIFDVLNILHDKDENSNTEMTKVMQKFNYIREVSRAQITVIHHDTKASLPGAKKPRGASAIDSWWDWKVSISPNAEDETIKDIYFATKADRAQPKMTVCFASFPDGSMRITSAEE